MGPWVLLVVWVYGFSPRASSGDPGVKLAQAESLWKSGFQSRGLLRDEKTDPQGSYTPYGLPFVRVVDGEIQGIYSVVFTALAAPPVGLLGMAGAPVVPLLGSLLLAFGLGLLLRRLGAHPAWTFATCAIALLATPILLYSSELFEHTLAAGLVAMALAVTLPGEESRRPRPFLAGLLVGAAGAVRPEAYCAVAALGIAVALAPAATRRERLLACIRYLAGALAVLVPYWLLNLATASAWDPAVATNVGRSATMEGARTILITRIKDGSWLWFLCLPAVALAALVPPRLVRGRARLAAFIVAGLGLAVLGYLAQEHSTDRTTTGLLAVTPLACWGLATGPFEARTRLLWIFVLLYGPLVVLLDRSGTAGGFQVGARYMIPIIPVLLVLVANRVRHEMATGNRLVQAMVALPAALLLALTIRGFFGSRALPKYLGILDKGAAVEDVVRELHGQIVVTRRLWESRVLAPLTLEGVDIYTCQGELGSVLTERLAARGTTRFIYVSNRAVDIPLADGRHARTAQQHTGWMPLQEVSIQ